MEKLKIKKMEKNNGIKIDGNWYYMNKNYLDNRIVIEVRDCEDFKKLMFNKIYN